MASAIVICFMSLLPLDEGLNRGFFSPLLRGPGAAVGLEGWRTPAPEEREVEHGRLHAGHSSRDTSGMGEKKRRSAGAAQTHAARSRALAAQSDFGPALEEMVRALEVAPELGE